MGVKQIVGAILVGFSLIAWVIADAANLVREEWTGGARLGTIDMRTYHLVGIHYIVLIGLMFAVGIVLLIWDWRGQLKNTLVKFKNTLCKAFPRKGWSWGWVVLVILLAIPLVIFLGILIAAIYDDFMRYSIFL